MRNVFSDFDDLYALFEKEFARYNYAKGCNLRMAVFEPPDVVVEADGGSVRCWRPP